MADNLEDREAIVAGHPASNISNVSSALTDLGADSQPGNPPISAGSSVLSRDFVNTGMDVVDNEQSRDNEDRDSAAKVQNEAAEGSTDTDADAASSTVEDTSTVGSHEEDGGGAINSSMQIDGSDIEEPEPPHLYNARIKARRKILQDSTPSYNTSQKYHFSSIYNIPQQTVQTHTIALPPCSSHLFTGGSDGYIRRYAWYASLRNYSSERHPVLKGYWENLSITAIQARGLLWNQSMQDDPTRIRFGPAGISGGTTVPVHSLAVQRDELYCLAGSAEGVINLYSVRLDEGQCRACLGITGKSHKRNTPISALALSEGDSSLLSGGWDKQILQWDLNTGQCVRDFVGHKNPISTLLFRPSASDQTIADAMIASSHSVPPENTAAHLHTERANPTTAISTAITGAKSETTTTTKQDRPSNEREGDTEVAPASRAASYDPLFDDDHSVRGGGGGTTRGNSPSRLNSPNSAAMEISNTTDSTAPSGGLTFPGLNDNGNSVNGNGGFSSLSSLLAMGGGGDNRLAVASSSIPTPVKLPPIDLPHIPSFREASPNNENLQPLKPPPPSTDSENTDVFVSLAIDGECLIWDRRVDKGNVRRLDIPKGCPPWSVSATWSPTGNAVYVGRRNAQVSVYDLRTSTVQSIHLPKSSGRVTALHAMRDHRHLLISSNDTVRLWNLEEQNFTIVPSMGSSSSSNSSSTNTAYPNGGTNGTGATQGTGVNGVNAASAAGNAPLLLSGGYTTFVADAREKYLFASCGSRGWLENGREEIGSFEIDVGGK